MRKPYRFPREKLRKAKTYRFCDAVLFGNPRRGFAKKLLTIKMVRFYGKVFVEQDLSVLFKKLKSFLKEKRKTYI
jgi:hypothetical protein